MLVLMPAWKPVCMQGISFLCMMDGLKQVRISDSKILPATGSREMGQEESGSLAGLSF